MSYRKKLIEVALPLDAINVESAREILKEFDKESCVAAAETKVRSSIQTAPGAAAAAAEEDDEAMWKEKYDELKAEFDLLRDSHDKLAAAADSRSRSTSQTAKGGSPLSPPMLPPPGAADPGIGRNGVPSLNEIYLYVKARAVREDPPVLEVLAQHPELVVKRERKRIEQDATTLRGALAILIAEKFFDGPREFADVRRELIRRGMLGSKAPNQQVSQSLQGIVEFGFLTKEESGYQAVPGMKVNIVES